MIGLQACSTTGKKYAWKLATVWRVDTSIQWFRSCASLSVLNPCFLCYLWQPHKSQQKNHQTSVALTCTQSSCCFMLAFSTHPPEKNSPQNPTAGPISWPGHLLQDFAPRSTCIAYTRIHWRSLPLSFHLKTFSMPSWLGVKGVMNCHPSD